MSAGCVRGPCLVLCGPALFVRYMGSHRCHVNPTQLQSAVTAGMLLHCRRHCWPGLLSMCLAGCGRRHRLAPGLARWFSILYVHDHQCLGSCFLLWELSLLVTQCLIKNGSPRLGWTLQALSTLAVLAPARAVCLLSSHTLIPQERSFRVSAQLPASSAGFCMWLSNVPQPCHWLTPLTTYHCHCKTCSESPQR